MATKQPFTLPIRVISALPFQIAREMCQRAWRKIAARSDRALAGTFDFEGARVKGAMMPSLPWAGVRSPAFFPFGDPMMQLLINPFVHHLAQAPPSPDAPPTPFDALFEIERWTIDHDETIVPEHPLCALAFARFFQNAVMGDPSGEHAKRAILLLAKAMAGDRDPDGLDPFWTERIDASYWALRQGGAVAQARALSIALAEQSQFDQACPPISPDRCKRNRL